MLASYVFIDQLLVLHNWILRTSGSLINLPACRNILMNEFSWLRAHCIVATISLSKPSITQHHIFICALISQLKMPNKAEVYIYSFSVIKDSLSYVLVFYVVAKPIIYLIINGSTRWKLHTQTVWHEHKKSHCVKCTCGNGQQQIGMWYYYLPQICMAWCRVPCLCLWSEVETILEMNLDTLRALFHYCMLVTDWINGKYSYIY
jgi:hypothetical protein